MNFTTDIRVERKENYAKQDANTTKKKKMWLENFLGFNYCSDIQMSPSGRIFTLQRGCYSGHKRMQCFLYQTITTVIGIMIHIYSPGAVLWRDIRVLRKNQIKDTLREVMVIDRMQYCINGDVAYILLSWVQTLSPLLPKKAQTKRVYIPKIILFRKAFEWS